MRLKKLQKILTDNIDNLNIIKEASESGGWTTVPKYSKLIGAINNIKDTGTIDKEFTFLEQQSYFAFSNGDKVKLDNSRFAKLNREVQTIQAKCEAILLVIDKVLPESNEDQKVLVINFPAEPITISDFKSMIDKLDKFTKSLTKLEFEDNKSHSDEPVVSHFDVGSEWLVLAFSFIGFVPVIVKAANGIQDFRIKNREIKLLDHQLDALDIDVETKEKLSAALDKHDQTIGDELAPGLIKNTNLLDSAENEATVIKLIKQLDDLFSLGISLEKGVNIETNNQESFPTIEKQKQISKNKEISTDKESKLDNS